MSQEMSEKMINEILNEIKKSEEFQESGNTRIVSREEIKKIDDMVIFSIKKFSDSVKNLVPDVDFVINHTYSATLSVKEYAQDVGKETFFYRLTFAENCTAFVEFDPLILFTLVNTPMPEGNFIPTKFQKQVIQSYIVTPLIEAIFFSMGFRENERNETKVESLDKKNLNEDELKIPMDEKGIMFQFLWNLQDTQWAITNLFISEPLLDHMRKNHVL